jgi:hypothetical protein
VADVAREPQAGARRSVHPLDGEEADHPLLRHGAVGMERRVRAAFAATRAAGARRRRATRRLDRSGRRQVELDQARGVVDALG